MRSKMFFNDRFAWSTEIWTICLLAIRLISQFPLKSCRFSRKYSRTTRLILLRLTAGPTFFVTVMPIRDRPSWLGANTAIKCSFCILRPISVRATNSCRFNILSAFVREKRNGQASHLVIKKKAAVEVISNTIHGSCTLPDHGSVPCPIECD